MAEAQQIILHPVITEKSARQMEEEHVYTFLVAEKANKIEIARAIEKLFDVTVKDVRTMRYAGKYRRSLLGQMAGNVRNIGRRADFKKALVRLDEADHIEFYEVG